LLELTYNSRTTGRFGRYARTNVRGRFRYRAGASFTLHSLEQLPSRIGTDRYSPVHNVCRLRRNCSRLIERIMHATVYNVLFAPRRIFASKQGLISIEFLWRSSQKILLQQKKKTFKIICPIIHRSLCIISNKISTIVQHF